MGAGSTAGPSRITIVFDGGSIGNPGDGYGSYVVLGVAGSPRPVRITFPGVTTNNQAEYQTLIHALNALLAELRRQEIDPKSVGVDIYSDSQLVVEQVAGRWKVRNAELRPRVEEVRRLLGSFGDWTLRWHSRAESVRWLGH